MTVDRKVPLCQQCHSAPRLPGDPRCANCIPRIPPGYTWPTFTREHDGESFTFGVHLVRDDDDHTCMFAAFRADLLDHDRQIVLLRHACEAVGSRPMPLVDGGCPEAALLAIAQDFCEHPGVAIVFGPADAMDTPSN